MEKNKNTLLVILIIVFAILCCFMGWLVESKNNIENGVNDINKEVVVSYVK